MATMIKSHVSKRSISVCIVERNLLAAEYLGRILERDAHLSLRTVRDVSALSNLALGKRPSALITTEDGMSMPMPEFVAALRRLWPGSAVVFVANPEFAGEIRELGIEGPIGFVAYHDVAKKLVSTVRRVGLGFPVSDAAFPSDAAAPDRAPLLTMSLMTQREVQVLDLLRYQLSSKEIAHVLDIAEVTVKFHISNMFSKTRVNRRRDLLALCEGALTYHAKSADV
ncbi:MAG TPA: LuxR C-terminal-related transcriptional regulator [Candidatus Angelobacter sp.]|nr:LuxR C-terminal-related transcriptional regulator [Candidatus Angelobacter sp.]